ncbi:hypothetical protein ACU8MP_29585 (plasmid) [Rhizobium leguminosarum]
MNRNICSTNAVGFSSGLEHAMRADRRPRRLLQSSADELGLALELTVLPLWLLPIAGLFNCFLKEVWDMRYT